jgi:hypothetical protein
MIAALSGSGIESSVIFTQMRRKCFLCSMYFGGGFIVFFCLQQLFSAPE